MRDQCLAFFRPANNKLYDILWSANPVPAFNQRSAHSRCLLRRFEQHHIARNQGGDHVTIGQVSGEIVRAQHRHDAMGFVAHGGSALQRAVELFLAGPLGIGLHRDIDLGDDRIDFGLCLPQRLARFVGDEVC